MSALAIMTALNALPATQTTAMSVIPAAKGTALDGRVLALPHDLPGGASILILGFDRNSASTTTAWEKPVRTQLASATTKDGLPAIGYLDMPFLEEAPAFIRPLILHSIRNQVPDVVKPHFVPLTSGEASWKQAAHYSADAPNAAYVLLVDRDGKVRWQTHEAFSPSMFEQLSVAARRLAAEAA